MSSESLNNLCDFYFNIVEFIRFFTSPDKILLKLWWTYGPMWSSFFISFLLSTVF